MICRVMSERTTWTTAAYTSLTESTAAGADLAAQIASALEGDKPDAVIVFASSGFDYAQLLSALSAGCQPACLVGSSSAGEFTNLERGEGTACALAIRSADLKFAVGVGRAVGSSTEAAAREALSGFQGVDGHEYAHRAAVVMTDALAGHADSLIEYLTLHTNGKYQFVGGGAGDDAKFARTHVFCGTEALTDGVVALEVLSHKPLGVGVHHGWEPASDPFRVTGAEGMRLISLNGFPAVEAFEQHAERTGQTWDPKAPLSFFLHNILGIDTPHGYRLRVPLNVAADGSVECAAEVPLGATVRLMRVTSDSAIDAASSATQAAVRALGGATPAGALFFDCVATRLRMGDVFGFELDAVARSLGHAAMVGCNTYGQIARGDGQFGGFHNCTAVVFALPE